MNPRADRLDLSLMDPAELDRLVALVGLEGVRIELPDPIFHALVNLLRQMQQGRTIVLMPEDETFTTKTTKNRTTQGRRRR